MSDTQDMSKLIQNQVKLAIEDSLKRVGITSAGILNVHWNEATELGTVSLNIAIKRERLAPVINIVPGPKRDDG